MREIHNPERATVTGGYRNPAADDTTAGERRPWWVMVLLGVAQFMVILDATAVNVARDLLTGTRPSRQSGRAPH